MMCMVKERKIQNFVGFDPAIYGFPVYIFLQIKGFEDKAQDRVFPF